MNREGLVQKTVNFGNEYDEAVFKALREVLAVENTEQLDYTYGVGGSQEVQVWTFRIGGEMLEATAETYIGLTITGEAATVTRIACAVKEKLGRRGE